jgi:Holliday junction DNA helicase RuvB
MGKALSKSTTSHRVPGDAQLAPATFGAFVGQERIKARLKLAIEAAQQRGEAPGHVLLIGPPASGKATLAKIVPAVMGSRVVATNAMSIEKVGDLAGLLTSLEEGDVLLIEDLHTLDKSVAEFLCQPMKDFNMDIMIDSGANARSVRLNLPNFTLVGTALRRDRMPAAFLSSFEIVEHMDAYGITELVAMADRFAKVMKLDVEDGLSEKVALSACVSPRDVLNRLRHLRDYVYTSVVSHK